MRRITFICVIALLSLNAIAQSKPVALKFDEFVYDEQYTYAETEESARERIDRLAKRLRFERNKNVFIIHYRARVMQGSNRHRLSNFVSSAQWLITGKTVTFEDVYVIDGGLRQFDTIEFWIAPKNAEPPTPTPTFARSEGIECPSIMMYQAGISFDKTTPVVFMAESRPSGADSYNWTVSDGVVIGPNGTTRLEVDVSKVQGDRITAFVEFAGVPLPCKNRAIAVAEFGNRARLVDEFGRAPNGDIKGRLDSLLATLSEHPNAQAFALIYGGRDAQGRDAEGRKRLFASHFMFRNFDASRITIVDAGFREEIATQLWLVPPGAVMPIPTPSVDKIFVRLQVRRASKKRT